MKKSTNTRLDRMAYLRNVVDFHNVKTDLEKAGATEYKKLAKEVEKDVLLSVKKIVDAGIYVSEGWFSSLGENYIEK